MRGPLYPLIYGYSFTADSIPSVTGKVIIVTGGNTGIGLETARELYVKGAKVYIACRTQKKAEDAIATIRASTSAATAGQIAFIQLDLMDFESVRQCASQFTQQEERLDVLINNAGIMAVDYKLTKDGCEQQFQTNHLSHFLLTHLLLPHLRKSSDPRIVNVSSVAHERFFKDSEDSFVSFEAVNGERDGPWSRYGQSKISNVLFTQELAKRFPDILSNSCHPGNIDSDLYNHLGSLRTLMKVASASGAFLKPADGALTQLYLATSPQVVEKKITGRYFVPIAKEKAPSPAANVKNAERLWTISEAVFSSRNISLTL